MTSATPDVPPADDHTPLPVPLAEHAGAPTVCKANGAWTVRFNRPDEHNRIDPLDVDCLLAFLPTVTLGNPAALVITGNESRSFSSGYTLDAIVSDLDDRFERLLDVLETLPCLTIAAINGNVYGGATDLALCCDIRIGQTDSRMFMPAARIGLHYYPGGLRRYVTRLGLSAATKLMLTGVTIDADEMHRIGFLTDLVSPPTMDAQVAQYLDAARQTEPRVVAKMKSHMLAIAGSTAQPDYDKLNEAITQDYRQSVASPELKQRLAARLKK